MMSLHCSFLTEKLLLNDDITNYYFVSQGKTSIPGVDDKEEFIMTDVSYCRRPKTPNAHVSFSPAPLITGPKDPAWSLTLAYPY